MFPPGAVSSTPRAAGGVGGGAGDESWEDSMESPFDRLDRRLRDDLRIEGYASSDAPTPSLPSGYNLPDSTYGDVSTGTVEPVDLPSMARPKGDDGDTPKPMRTRNPFSTATDSNANATSSTSSNPQWNGITDLRSTPLNARFSKSKPKPGPSASELDDSDDDIHLNMSPPVTMNFTLPPRAQAVNAAGRTPVKSAAGVGEGKARMILDDLMEEMERGYEPSPRMPTPEGLGRYSVLPHELGQGRSLFDPSRSNSYRANAPRKSVANTSFGSDGVLESQSQPTQVYNDDDDSFDVDDSFDSPGQGPSQYYVAQPDNQQDISGISSNGGMSPTTSEAGMIFGGQPKRGPGEGAFSLMKPDEMMTYHGGRLEDAELAESPTNPMGGRGGERSRGTGR